MKRYYVFLDIINFQRIDRTSYDLDIEDYLSMPGYYQLKFSGSKQEYREFKEKSLVKA